MEHRNVTELFENESLILPDLENVAGAKPWYPHPAFEGVFLKDLITGQETDGKFSYHLVRVWKNKEVTDHDHETQWEWNRIIGGKGVFVIGDKEVVFGPGQTFVTPPKVHHTVAAYDEDLSLLALFVPALV